eukprot:364681-Chlamydomonas_euryale.AAC.6
MMIEFWGHMMVEFWGHMMVEDVARASRATAQSGVGVWQRTPAEGAEAQVGKSTRDQAGRGQKSAAAQRGLLCLGSAERALACAHHRQSSRTQRLASHDGFRPDHRTC